MSINRYNSHYIANNEFCLLGKTVLLDRQVNPCKIKGFKGLILRVEYSLTRMIVRVKVYKIYYTAN